MGLIKKILNLQGTAEGGTVLNIRGVKNTLLKVADSLTGNIFSFRNRDKVELLNIKNDGIYTPNLIDTSNTSYKSLVIDENGKIQKKQAFLGDYDDLSNLPTLFSGNYNDLSNLPDLSLLNDVVIEDSLNDFPSVGNNDFVYIAKNTGEMYRWNGSSYTQLTDQTAIWGQISGTLSNQNDLQNALNGKADNADVFSGNYNDLLNLPTLFSGNYNDLNNRPILSAVATSGDYGDLHNKPNLSIYVDKSSNETITGEKTFTSNSIFSDGVGIGINPPLAKLDVNGASVFRTTDNYNVGPNVLRVNGLGMLGNRNTLFLTNRNPTGNIKFGIGGRHGTASEKMTLTSTGDLGIGTTNPSDRLGVNGDIRIDSGNGGVGTLNVYGSSQSTGRVYVGQDNRYGGGIEYNGNRSPVTTGAGRDYITLWRRYNNNEQWTARNRYNNNDWEFRGDVEAFTSSDKRFKDNILNIQNPLDKISKIGGYTYEWNDKSDKETGKKDIGVIAQEIEKVLPELVQNRENGYKAVKYDKIVALLVEGIKEQDKKITDLQSQINEIYKRI
jgi:hypothetical protein